MRKRILLAGSMAAVMATSAIAATLTPDEALSRLASSAPHRMSAAGAMTEPQLIATGQSGDLTAYYIFASGERTLFVGADDAAAPLLGYIDRRVENPDQMPPQMKWWLSEYGREIAYASGNGKPAFTPAPRQADDQRRPIEPLVSTRWDQSAPYNDSLPESNGIRCYTGCVATAMAQAMKYFNWPEKGTGTLSYSWDGSEMSMNLDSTTFEWGEMLDTYTSATDGTDTERAAVSTLMKACGYSVKMNYGSSSAGSGASPFSIVPALVGHFGYDKGTELVMRDFYTIDEWNEMIYRNLATTGPVIYGGESPNGGHCFICDGYESDGYFHINWGWSGDYDGYFLLSALDPAGQGAGGSEGGYNSNQDAVIGMKKPVEGSEYPAPYLALQGTLTGAIANGVIELGGGYQGGFFNLSNYSGNFDIGLQLKNSETGETIYLTSGSNQTIASMAGIIALEYAAPTDLAYGTYEASPVYRVNGSDWTPFKIPQSSPSYITIVSNADGLSIASSGSLSITGFSAPDGFDIGTQSTVIAHISNSYDELLEVQISLHLCRLIGGTSLSPVVNYGTETIDLNARSGASATFSTVIPNNIPSGEYYVVFTDQSGNIIYDPELVTVNLPSGVDSITADTATDETATYYDLQGHLIGNGCPPAGLYIKVSPDGRATKVMVR